MVVPIVDDTRNDVDRSDIASIPIIGVACNNNNDAVTIVSKFSTIFDYCINVTIIIIPCKERIWITW